MTSKNTNKLDLTSEKNSDSSKDSGKGVNGSDVFAVNDEKISKKIPKKEKKIKKERKKKGNGKKSSEPFKNYFLGKSKKQKRSTKIFWGKKFIGFIFIFSVYSLILVTRIKGSRTSVWMESFFNAITFNDPYAMGVTLVFTFILFMILFCNTKIKQFYFGKLSWLKQLIILPIAVISMFYICNYLISLDFNIMPMLFILGMLWVIFQGFRLYYGARSFSTKLETKMLSKYSWFRYVSVIIIPFIILIFLTTVVWAYRYYLVSLTLDLITNLVPGPGLVLYRTEMSLILPFLYISLILIFVLLSIEFILTRRKSNNKRVGAFDNFAYSLIVFFMFIYLLYQISMYLFVNPQTVNALKGISGGSTGSSYLYIVEFVVSILFLFRAMMGIGKSFGWNVLFLNQDAIVMGLLAIVMAQTTSRVGLFAGITSQDIGSLGNLLTIDHLLIPIIIMLFLGITILIYYLKPQEVSMFMRIAKQNVDEEDKAMDLMHKFLKREFIRRGEKFPIAEVEPQLLAISNLPRGLVISLIKRLVEKHYDIHIVTEDTPEGKEKFIEFISIVEKYASSKKSYARVQQVMTGRFVDSISKKKKKISLSKKKVSEVHERESFLTALDSSYSKKIKDQEARMKKITKSTVISSTEELDSDTIDVVYALVRNEFIYRAQKLEDYQECAMNVSEISSKVFQTSKISPEIFSELLIKISQVDWNLKLVRTINNSNIDENGKNRSKNNNGTIGKFEQVDFFPIDDFEISDILKEFRPKKFHHLVEFLWSQLIESLSVKKKKMICVIDGQKIGFPVEFENFSITDYYSVLFSFLNKSYQSRMNSMVWNRNKNKILEYLTLIQTGLEKSTKH